VPRDDSGDSLRDQSEQPRRLRDYLRQPVAVEPVAIHPDVDHRRRPKPNRKRARDIGGVKVVHLGIQHRSRPRLRASTMRRDQQNR